MEVLQMMSEGRRSGPGFGDGGGHLLGIVAVDPDDDVPAAATKRKAAVLSANQGATWPSMEMPLSSYSAISLPSFQAPARRDGFPADAFHQQPSPRKVGVVVDDGVAVAGWNSLASSFSASAMPARRW